MPRRVEHSPELRAALLDALRAGLALANAAPHAGVSYGHAWKWINSDPDLRAEYEAARAFGKATPAAITQRRATAVASATVRERRKRGWCDDKACGACYSCAQRGRALAAWASGAFDGRPIRPHRLAWLPAHDARLRVLAGTRPSVEIAALLTAEFGIPRTQSATRTRAVDLGVSLYRDTGMTARELARAFGAQDRSAYLLARDGVIPARRSGPSEGAHLWFDLADVRRFIRECPWAYDYRAMAPGPLRNLAETIQRSDPWLPLREVAAYLGVTESAAAKYAKRGIFAAKWRRLGSRGGLLVVRRSALVQAEADLVAWRAEARARRVAHVAAARWGHRAGVAA